MVYKKGTSSSQQELDKETFAYWQSMADKQRNENERLKAELEAAKSQQSQVFPEQTLPANLPHGNPQGQPSGMENYGNGNAQAQGKPPVPPTKPQRPKYFSRVEASSDDNSESARYLDEMDNWRSDMVQYNADVQAHNDRQRQAQWEAQQEAIKKQEMQKQMAAQQQAKMQYIANHLRKGYQATEEQVQGFFNEMSRQNSVSMDNLWKLYAMNHGIPIQNTAPIGGQQQEILQPSPEFLQQQQAQQVPSPMGILPANSPESAKSEVDLMMDTMLKME